MNDVLAQLTRWAAAGREIAVATVVDVHRSAPRPPGTKMLVSDHGEIAGGVSGGCVEGAVVEEAAAVLAGGPPRLRHYGWVDDEAWDVGLPCGGEIDVWVERWDHDALAAAASAGERAALVTVMAGERLGARLFARADGSVDGTLGDAALDAAAVALAEERMWLERSVRTELLGETVFVDVVAPPPRIIAVGAIDLSASLCAVARVAGFVPFVVDPRGQFATKERFSAAEDVVVAWPEEAFAQLGGLDRATAVCVLTHDPKIDDAALLTALRSDVRYIGAMGSRRAQATRRARLLDAGVSEGDLARISAPIGLDLGGVGPHETALSILAEIVALRHGRDGGRLARAAGRVHRVEAA